MIVVLASLALLSVQPRHASKESKTKQELVHFTKLDSAQRSSSVEHDDHWEFEYLPFFAFAWKRSEELESYDVL